MRNIMKKCDVVILPEEGDDKENIMRVGPIVRTTKNSREELRKQLEEIEKKEERIKSINTKKEEKKSMYDYR